MMLLMSGCGVGINSAETVDPTTTTSAVSLGRIQGSNYGGHAPIVGANVYVLQIGAPAVGATPATQTGYGSAVSSLLTSTYNDPSYPTAQDSSGDATNGFYYVQTDGQGNFDVSGDYTCTPGYPVYLYAQGGNPRTNPAVSITKAVVSGSGPYTITFTTAGQLLYQGEPIKFTAAGAAGTFAAYISNQSATVIGSNSPTSPTTTSFQIQVTSLTNGAYSIATNTTYSGTTLSTSGVITTSERVTQNNPAIANVAMLGLCPSSGAANFSYLNFVYINEVSTVAMAYAMAPFAVDSLHIGTSTTNLKGLQNAALNAATLYNIQGGPASTTIDGEGHIANSVNPVNSNGTVPEATINTLANIVANCVDSSNTVVGTTPAAVQAESAGCSGLFLAATSNGVPVSNTVAGATVPIDTATAMINLAHYPAGLNSYPTTAYVDSTNPSTIFNLPTGNVPYTPQLSTAPKDWTIALTYKSIPTPGAIAIDANGDAYIGTKSTTAGYITELSPQGSVLAGSTTSVSNLYGLAISSDGSVWATSNTATSGSNSNIYKFPSTLGAGTAYQTAYTSYPTSIAADSSGHVYVVNNSANYNYYYISELNSTGGLLYETTNYEFSVANGIALATSGSLWLSDSNNDFGLYPNPSSGNGSGSLYGGFNNTGGIAVDYQGYAWITGQQTGNQALVRSSTGGVLASYGINAYDNFAIGGINNPVAVAVDGSNANKSNTFNVWVANSGNNTVSEVNSSSQYTTLSPSVGYQSGTGAVNTPSAIAVDNAGNVWVTNQGNSTVTEIIGSGNPVATPFSAMKPGVAP